MSESNIWKKILLIDSVILFVFGAVFELSPIFFSDFSGNLYNTLYGSSLSADSETLRYINLLIGLTGAVLLGWGAMAVYLSYKLLSEDNDNDVIWNAFTIALLVWYIEDSFVSITFGAPLNVVLNSIFLILFLIPILGRRFSK